ncbi:hypothetical protein SUGI_0258260 [Cryptomeria japonica]|nr:hypothetical protein SUGI_0258260 [Cryptomeria japonica]
MYSQETVVNLTIVGEASRDGALACCKVFRSKVCRGRYPFGRRSSSNYAFGAQFSFMAALPTKVNGLLDTPPPAAHLELDSTP